LRSAFNERKGFVLTLEALLSLFSLVLIFSSYQLIKKNYISENMLAKFILLSDAFEVLEKSYHKELSEFIDEGTEGEPIAQLFHLVEQKTGNRIYLQYNNRWLPEKCERDIFTDRLLITKTASNQNTQNKWHEIEIGLCKRS